MSTNARQICTWQLVGSVAASSRRLNNDKNNILISCVSATHSVYIRGVPWSRHCRRWDKDNRKTLDVHCHGSHVSEWTRTNSKDKFVQVSFVSRPLLVSPFSPSSSFHVYVIRLLSLNLFFLNFLHRTLLVCVGVSSVLKPLLVSTFFHLFFSHLSIIFFFFLPVFFLNFLQTTLSERTCMLLGRSSLNTEIIRMIYFSAPQRHLSLEENLLIRVK